MGRAAAATKVVILTSEVICAAATPMMELFDRSPDAELFGKEAEWRTMVANERLPSRRCVARADLLLGRTASDPLPPQPGRRHLDQDLAVARADRALEDPLELDFYPDHRGGWCLTTDLPARETAGRLLAEITEAVAADALACGRCGQRAFMERSNAAVGLVSLELRRRQSAVRGE